MAELLNERVRVDLVSQELSDFSGVSLHYINKDYLQLLGHFGHNASTRLAGRGRTHTTRRTRSRTACSLQTIAK
jgi:hypothetical protein